MIKLSRPEFREIIRSFMIANTPKSLFRSLALTSAVHRLRTEVEMAELATVFVETTGRANRSPLTLALAYAYLIAFLTSLKKQAVAVPEIDASRLTWGDEMRRYVPSGISSSSDVLFQIASPIPRAAQALQIYTGSSTAAEKHLVRKKFTLSNS